MFIKQLSVFIENRKGRLEQVTAELTANNINIIALSLADTNEYGLLRMIVSDPVAAKDTLCGRGFSAMLTDVLAVRMQNKPGQLYHMLSVFSGADLNVEYMYVLDSSAEYGSMVVKVTNAEKAPDIIKSGGLELFDEKAVYSIVHK
ncbi:MAG: amino acid-binding protein [Acidobacteriota bacterium]|jgi:hypothetical protein|nr:amino acid-binding protein [Acidobacteriota bacterium]